MRKTKSALFVNMLVIVSLFSIAILPHQVSAASEREILEGDTLEIDSYFNGDAGISTRGPLLHGVSFRMRPGPGTSQSVDRLYAAGGKGTGFDPNGLYAYEPQQGASAWPSPFNTNSPISTPVLVNNFGSTNNVGDSNVRIYFGCDDGRLYLLRDGFTETWSNFAPTGDNVWSYQLDGSVVGITFYELRGGDTTELIDNPFNNYDMFFAGTDSGKLYAFEGPTPQLNPVTGSYNVTHPNLLWVKQVSTMPLTSPTVSSDGKYVFVGSSDGLLYGFDVVNDIEIPDWDGPYRVSESQWLTSPVAAGNPPLVYAATGDGLIHCVLGLTGLAKEGWSHVENGNTNNGYRLKNAKGIDGGSLTDIEILPDGSQIIVGSDTGFVYSLDTNTIKQSFTFDARIGRQKVVVNIKPYYDSRYSNYLFVAARHLNNTAVDPSDDFSILYCMASFANSTVIWRKAVEGVITAPPISFINNARISKADIVFATVFYELDGTPVTSGRMYSYGVGAQFIMNEESIPGFDLLTISIAIITAVAIVKITRITTRKK